MWCLASALDGADIADINMCPCASAGCDVVMSSFGTPWGNCLYMFKMYLLLPPSFLCSLNVQGAEGRLQPSLHDSPHIGGCSVQRCSEGVVCSDVVRV